LPFITKPLWLTMWIKTGKAQEHKQIVRRNDQRPGLS
jgi:hypothetical protein